MTRKIKPAPCSHAALLKRLSYDPETGKFTWLDGKRAGKEAGTVQHNGYVTITFVNGLWLAHRLAWFYVTGEWPKDQIDHKNHARTDNRFSNLREATDSGNNANRQRGETNRCGFKGVHARDGKYRAQIWDRTRNLHLGYFDTAEAAHSAYVTKAKQLFGEFSCGV